jgi:hypothetical protein
VKARLIRHIELDAAFGEPSHVLALGAGRAAVVSRYKRRVARIDEHGGVATLDLEPFARTPRAEAVDLGRRGAPFRWEGGFGIAYRDVLHLWPAFDGPFQSRAMAIPQADSRGAHGRLEPLLACAAGKRAAIVALHAGAASVHGAHRTVRITWDEPAESEALWDARDVYVDERVIPGFESAGDPAREMHPPALQAIRFQDGAVVAHTTGASKNHMRYGMWYSALVAVDAAGATRRLASLPDGYAVFGPNEILLRALHPKKGGLDFAVLDLQGGTTGELRLTKKAMAPVEDSWLVYDVNEADLWLADGNGRVALFALAS